MNDEQAKRKLTAIFSADVKGYSRLMQDDEEAIRLDPQCSSAWTTLAYTYNLEVRLGFSQSPSESLKRAMESGQKALELDDTQSEVHTFWTAFYTLQGEYDKALAEGQKSIELGPSDSLAQTDHQ